MWLEGPGYFLRKLKKAMAITIKPIPVIVGGIILFVVPR
jgi:hypothetical protein